MIDEANLRDRYEELKPTYDAWGKYVCDTLEERIIEALGRRTPFGDLLKLPAQYRVKRTDSFIAKALYRGKEYEDPLAEITDIVGTRFVVLLEEHVEKIQEVIEGSDEWDISKERDHKEERSEEPLVFDYQSVHYLIRPREDLEINDVLVNERVACEVQVRTLLQHAYSELTHDTVYKPKLIATPEIKRLVAKAMALMEVTGDVFSRVKRSQGDMNAQIEHILTRLTDLYEEYIAPADIERSLNLYILDSLVQTLEGNHFDPDDIASFLKSEEGQVIVQTVQDRREGSLLYRQPVVLLLYYLASEANYKRPLARSWPLSPAELEPIFTDLGTSLAAA